MERTGATLVDLTAWRAAVVARGAARRARFPLQTESVREDASMVGERNEALCSNRRGLLYSVVIKTKQMNKYTCLVLVETSLEC